MNLKFEEFDESGVQNLMLAMVASARQDYIKGYVAIKNKFGKILTLQEFNDWVVHVHKKRKDDFVNRCVNRCMGFYESKEFVEKDQYNLFNELQSKILTSWNELAEEELAAKSLVKK